MKKILLISLTIIGLGTSLFGKTTNSASVLSESQKEKLKFMYQEEKLARDIYITLGNKYDNFSTFLNIQTSEQTHTDAVENLCLKYGVDISNINESVVGVFVLPELQELYNQLLIQGSVSLLDALKVGVAIESKDITDILIAEQGMPTDVVRVFENLRAGSYNHLNAFQTSILNITN